MFWKYKKSVALPPANVEVTDLRIAIVGETPLRTPQTIWTKSSASTIVSGRLVISATTEALLCVMIGESGFARNGGKNSWLISCV